MRYGGSILRLNWGRVGAANLGCAILLKLMWGREDWLFNVNGIRRGGEKFQVPRENKKVKCRSQKPWLIFFFPSPTDSLPVCFLSPFLSLSLPSWLLVYFCVYTVEDRATFSLGPSFSYSVDILIPAERGLKLVYSHALDVALSVTMCKPQSPSVLSCPKPVLSLLVYANSAHSRWPLQQETQEARRERSAVRWWSRLDGSGGSTTAAHCSTAKLFWARTTVRHSARCWGYRGP